MTHGPGHLVRRLPPPRFLRVLGVRVLLIWILFRGIVSAGEAGLERATSAVPSEPGLTMRSRLVLLALVLLVTYVFGERRRELVFLGNLGISRRMWLLLAAIPPLVGELAIEVVR